MTGHQHVNQRQKPQPAADHRLDQFAAAVTEARTTTPALATLAATEDQFIEAAMDIGAHLDRQTVGAAWLILGQLFGTNLQSVPPEQQANQLGVLLNVAKLAGQRLYVGERLPVTVKCPFTYGADFTPCSKEITAPTVERLDALMGAHAWQNHPGCEWPLVADAEGCSVTCANCANAVAVRRHAVYGALCGACCGGFFDDAIARTEAALAKGDDDAGGEAQG